MKGQEWQWFVMGFMYRGESDHTPSSIEARKRFDELYDKFVDSVINPTFEYDGIVELCQKDTDEYGIERD